MTIIHDLVLCVPGAFGYFEVTHDITKYTKAKIFEHVGKKTPLLIRFSTVGKRKMYCLVAGNRGHAVRFTQLIVNS